MEIPSTARLVALGDSEMALADPGQDIRGRKVIGANGEEIGSVDDLLLDDADRKVRLLRIASGGFLGIGAATFLIPVDAIHHVTADAVHVD